MQCIATRRLWWHESAMLCSSQNAMMSVYRDQHESQNQEAVLGPIYALQYSPSLFLSSFKSYVETGEPHIALPECKRTFFPSISAPLDWISPHPLGPAAN